MNNPWLKVLVFSLLFGAVGFLLGKQCGGGCGKDRGHCERGMGCEKGGGACHGMSMCDHGGACCSGEGKCDMADCDHPGSMAGAGMGGACCKGMGHGKGGACHMGKASACKGSCKGSCDGSCGGSCGGHGSSACCKGSGDDQAKAIVAKLEAANFQGDTTIAIPGGTVKVNRSGTRTEVTVDIRDSAGVEEKVVEHHH